MSKIIRACAALQDASYLEGATVGQAEIYRQLAAEARAELNHLRAELSDTSTAFAIKCDEVDRLRAELAEALRSVETLGADVQRTAAEAERLRGELAETKRELTDWAAIAARESAEVTRLRKLLKEQAENCEHRKSFDAARADNEALRGRLNAINHCDECVGCADHDHYFIEGRTSSAPPSTVPLAAKYRCDSHVDCTNQGAPHENQQPATEPRGEATCGRCGNAEGKIVTVAGKLEFQCGHASCWPPVAIDRPAAPANAHFNCSHTSDGNADCDDLHAAPASAQGTAGPLSQLDRIEVDIAALEMARQENLEWREALAERITALDGRVSLQASTLRRMDKPAEPPQPAPVGTHAFVPGAVGDYCWTPNTTAHPTLIRCGQPRSAAVHGSGGGNG